MAWRAETGWVPLVGIPSLFHRHRIQTEDRVGPPNRPDEQFYHSPDIVELIHPPSLISDTDLREEICLASRTKSCFGIHWREHWIPNREGAVRFSTGYFKICTLYLENTHVAVYLVDNVRFHEKNKIININETTSSVQTDEARVYNTRYYIILFPWQKLRNATHGWYLKALSLG